MFAGEGLIASAPVAAPLMALGERVFEFLLALAVGLGCAWMILSLL